MSMVKETICDVIAKFMNGRENKIAKLPEIYEAVHSRFAETEREQPADETIRAAIYRAPKKYDFKRIAKGLYLLKGESTMSLLIEGSGRELDELDDLSIDCIITDHPWSDSKAHKSGNQKCFADYDTFVYQQSDFDAKARVLKEGSFLVEFLPVESATNWKYLHSIKEMAEKAGFQYYAQTIWRKAPEGAINTGRTTKGVEQMLLFTKGKPRRLAPAGKPYLTRNMLSYEIDIPANKGKDKNHQAEKPLALYEYLVENLTEPDEICLDQFGGACNLLKACENKGRWGICYELAKDFVAKAVERFKLVKVCDAEDINEEMETIEPITATEVEEKEEMERYIVTTIPKTSTEYQYEFIKKVLNKASNLVTDAEREKFESIVDIYESAEQINDLFIIINERGYANYKRPVFEIDLCAYSVLKEIYDDIDNKFVSIYPEFERPSNMNFKIEAMAFVEYAVVKEKVQNKEQLNQGLLDKYIDYLTRLGGFNVVRTRRLVEQYMLA